MKNSLLDEWSSAGIRRPIKCEIEIALVEIQDRQQHQTAATSR